MDLHWFMWDKNKISGVDEQASNNALSQMRKVIKCFTLWVAVHEQFCTDSATHAKPLKYWFMADKATGPPSPTSVISGLVGQAQ